jgi:chaperonin GroES
MNFKPLGKRVLVKRVEEEQTTASGIIIPDSAKEKPSEGIVKEIGSKVKDISKKDKVLFGQYSGTEISLDGEVYLLLNQDDILGIFKK